VVFEGWGGGRRGAGEVEFDCGFADEGTLDDAEQRRFVRVQQEGRRWRMGGNSQVLYTISGHKAAVAAVPRAVSLDFQDKPRNFCDPQGQNVEKKKKLCSRAMLLLPLRQLMLLGYEDGHIKECV
jgi:hypothetical protein